MFAQICLECIPYRNSIPNRNFLESKSENAIKLSRQECDAWFFGSFDKVLKEESFRSDIRENSKVVPNFSCFQDIPDPLQ